jgi:hypothetical protein
MAATMSGMYDAPVTVHYYEDVVFIRDTEDNYEIGPYGDVQTAQMNVNGQFITLPSGDYWLRGYTNKYGCFNPEPAVSGHAYNGSKPSVAYCPASLMLSV